MTNDFDQAIDRTLSNSSRWRQYGPDVLAMTTGDTDFAMPPAVREAILARCDHGVLGYDSVPDEVTQAIIHRLARLYNWQVEPKWLVYIQGVVPGLNQACRALVQPGAAVLSENPVYYRILEAPVNMGQKLKTVEALSQDGQDGQKEKSHWGFDFAGMEEIAAQADTQMLMLCNPQNPTGRAATKRELTRLAEICLANKLIVCSDEIHNEIIFDGHTHTPLASLSPEVSDITVTLMSPSKAFGVSGLGGAYAIISNPQLRRRFIQAGKGIVSYPNALAVAVMEAAYTQCDDWLAEMLAVIADNRREAVKVLAALPGARLIEPEATYFMWLDMRDTGLNDPMAALLEAGVAFSDGAKFGSPGFLRLNFATPKARLAEVLARVAGVSDMLASQQKN